MSEKGETVYTAARNPKFEQLRSDHETFLRTFESEQNVFVVFVLRYYYKRLQCVGFILNVVYVYFAEPTQIYRFLRTRNIITVS